MCACMPVRLHTWTSVCLCAFITCAPACLCAFLPVCLPAWAPTCLGATFPIFVPHLLTLPTKAPSLDCGPIKGPCAAGSQPQAFSWLALTCMRKAAHQRAHLFHCAPVCAGQHGFQVGLGWRRRGWLCHGGCQRANLPRAGADGEPRRVGLRVGATHFLCATVATSG
eukprot:363280-Chlamydomonas_euryale.AAC.12